MVKDMHTIIMLHGHPLSGKSTAANKIKEFLDNNGLRADIVKSVATRYNEAEKKELTKDFIDEKIEKTKKEKDNSYMALCSIAEEKVKGDIIPILDATFHKHYRREWVYDLSKKLDANVYIIWIEFDDIKKIKKMLEQRQNNHDFRDNILSKWEQHALMVEQTDSIIDNELKNNENIKMIRFDRAKKSLKFYNCSIKEKIVSLVCEALVG
ncbi:MAG: AAA family ATPase [Candidatus Woesearchaeota archaeon]|nr:AAA family ATPase [Candidatus Woesearchaeota archaeon]